MDTERFFGFEHRRNTMEVAFAITNETEKIVNILNDGVNSKVLFYLKANQM